MEARDSTVIRQLLDRLLKARARRDREVRFSDAWLAADDELRQIERAIFRVPVHGQSTRSSAGYGSGLAG